MNCPNCGRAVRSKTKCAFCGYRFDGSEDQTLDVEEVYSQEPKASSTYHDPQDDWYDDDWYDDEEVLPKTKRAGGALKMIWSILKLAIVIFLVFVAIAFGPRYIGQFLGGDNPLSGLFNSETTTEEITTVSQAPLEATTTVAPATSGDLEADVSAYPLTTLTIKLGENSSQIERTDLEVGVSANGQETLIDNYSILQEGNQVKISFNSPVDQTASAASEQKAFVRSASLGINQEATLAVPNLEIDTERAQALDKIFNDEVAKQASVSASFGKADEQVPYLYNDKTRNASHLLSWFILAKTYEAIEAGDMTLETPVTVLEELKAANDEGRVAAAEADTSFTVDELLNEMVENRDVTAMNHLIQANGGPNAFNLWLTENQYFSTKVNELLSTNDLGVANGSTTSAQDVFNLLSKLANDTLVSQDADTAIKERTLKSPATDKYPSGLEGVERRFEIVTDDRDDQSQAYAGIIQTEEGNYIFVAIAEEMTNPSDTNQAFAYGLGNTVTYALTGQANFELNQEEVTEETQAPVAEETQAPAVVEEITAEYQYGADTDGDGYANSVYDPTIGDYRAIRWVPTADRLNYNWIYAE